MLTFHLPKRRTLWMNHLNTVCIYFLLIYAHIETCTAFVCPHTLASAQTTLQV